MALAAALDVDIRRLTVPDPAAAGEHGPLWRAPPPPRAAILALVLTAPGALFITANTMAQRRLADAPLALLDEFGRTLGVVPAWWFLWPIPLIALPFAGILLVVASLLRVHGRHEGTAVTVTGIEIRWHPRAMLALFLAAATMVAPTANIAGEAIARAAQSLPR